MDLKRLQSVCLGASVLVYLYNMGHIFQHTLRNSEAVQVFPFRVTGELPEAKVSSVFPDAKTEANPTNFVPKIYQAGAWDLAPIVVEKYKLLFFTQGKVACTEFKKLLRRMMNLDDWNVHKEPKIPHNPAFNGLEYLYSYPLDRAMEMLTDPKWTRAIFVRDPQERFLSAYLDKAKKKNGIYVDRHCCPTEMNKENSCGAIASRSLVDFIQVVQQKCYCDAHWKPQHRRIDPELWQYINFVGYFDALANDTQRLLERLDDNAWQKFGASGWGDVRNESMFAKASTAKHRTSARAKLKQYFNESRVISLVEDFYEGDYARFQFQRS